MMFFMDAKENVYARYGGRDGRNADNRQSLAGLRATLQSVLKMHARAETDREFAAKSQPSPKFVRDEIGMRGKCMHCHQIREAYNSKLKKDGAWTRDLVWRYPPPDNLGVTLDVDKSNVIKSVPENSPAAKAGLRAGDIVRRLGIIPIHSFGDAQFALDRAAPKGSIAIAWQRGAQTMNGDLELPEGWRKSDISWRHSTRSMVPSVRLSGNDLAAAEKTALGFTPKQLAFRQSEFVSAQAKTAGIRAGDIIFGLDDQTLNMDSFELIHHVHRTYLVGDTVTVNLLREGKRMDLPMKLAK